MNSSDARLARILMDMNIEEIGRPADPQHLVISTEKTHLGWRWLLAQLGTWLVALGEHLVQYAPVRPAL